jgi:hypothetical protein
MGGFEIGGGEGCGARGFGWGGHPRPKVESMCDDNEIESLFRGKIKRIREEQGENVCNYEMQFSQMYLFDEDLATCISRPRP